MTETSGKSSLPTSEASPRSISSPASEAGRSPSLSPAGIQTGLFGQPLVPAPRSPSPDEISLVLAAKERVLSRALDELVSSYAGTASTLGTPTNGICGRRYGGSSESAALQSALESRLRRRMAAYGSPEYLRVWKSWVLPLGRRIPALRASERRTNDNGSIGPPGGWGTPRRVGRDGSLHGEPGQGRRSEGAARGSGSRSGGPGGLEHADRSGRTTRGPTTQATRQGAPAGAAGGGTGGLADGGGERRQQEPRGAPGHEGAHGRKPDGDHVALGAGEDDGRVADRPDAGLERRSLFGQPESAGGKTGRHDAWRGGVFIPCRDGRWRRVEPGIRLLADGVPPALRVGLIRGLGNAVVPELAAEFVLSVTESWPPASS